MRWMKLRLWRIDKPYIYLASLVRLTAHIYESTQHSHINVAHRWNLKFMVQSVMCLSQLCSPQESAGGQTRCLLCVMRREQIIRERKMENRRRQNESATPAFSSGRLSGWRMAFFMHFKAAHVAQPGHTPHHVRVSERHNQHARDTCADFFF